MFPLLSSRFGVLSSFFKNARNASSFGTATSAVITFLKRARCAGSGLGGLSSAMPRL